MFFSLNAPIFDSFRVQQAAGIFDVPLAEKVTQQFEAETPDLTEPDWKIGLIVGPSGSGKSSVARELFGSSLYEPLDWPSDRAILDGFDSTLSVREITALLTAVGFSSPPGWVKPFSVLSNGEKFRCDLARALSAGLVRQKAERNSDPTDSTSLESASPNALIAFDEFTSVVDRTVAKVASAAIAKGIRQGSIPTRFVAVTCHYDVAEWLEPDWVLDMANRKLIRRCLRRPEIQLEIHRTHFSVWPMFARHHYLSASLAPSARCFLATWNGTPVAFCGVLPLISHKNHRRISRLVTLPDFQGLGIGMRFAEAVGEIYHEQGLRLSITGSHPAVIAHCRRSPRWRTVSVKGASSNPKQSAIPRYRGSGSRIVVSFEFLPSTPY